MPFPVDIQYVSATERRLGVVFPSSFKVAMVARNGGTVGSDDDAWELHPFRDESDNKRLARTCNDIEYETRTRQKWAGFPEDAVEIGANGAGDALIFLRLSGEPDLLDPIVYWWDHETGEVHQLAEDFAELLQQ